MHACCTDSVVKIQLVFELLTAIFVKDLFWQPKCNLVLCSEHHSTLHPIYLVRLTRRIFLYLFKTMHMKFALVLFVTLVILLHTTDSWRRRRRRRCVGCAWSSWGSYGSCSASCNWGTKYRYRSRQTGSCGAVCSGSASDSASCYLGCCAVNCNWSWGSWGSCSGCGWSTRSRSVRIHQRAACGGRACPTTTTQSQRCSTGV